MPITSHDALAGMLSAEQVYDHDGSKLTSPVHTAGGWHCLMGMNGYPVASTFPGTSLLWQACDENSGDGTNIIGINHGGPMSGANTKHALLSSASLVAAAGAPWQAKLVDMQGYYKLSGADVTGTGSRTLINSNTFTASSSSGLLLTYTNDFVSGTKVRFTTTTTLPTGLSLATDYWLVRVSATTARVATSYANYVAGTVVAYTDGGTGTHTLTIQMRAYGGVNGNGCRAAFVVGTAPTLGGPNLTASSYTDQSGNTGAAFPGSPTMGAAADAYAGRVLHSGNAAGRYGAFLPLASGDTGIQKIDSFTFSGGTAYTGAGVLGLCVFKPILDLPCSATGQWNERELLNQWPSLTRIVDGACLVWMLFGTGATTANSPFTNVLKFVYGNA